MENLEYIFDYLKLQNFKIHLKSKNLKVSYSLLSLASIGICWLNLD